MFDELITIRASELQIVNINALFCFCLPEHPIPTFCNIISLKHLSTQSVIDKEAHLEVIEGLVCEIQTKSGSVTGVLLEDGRLVESSTVVIATGTFLRGLIHIGDKSFSGGRVGEKAAEELSLSFIDLGFQLSQE